MRLPKLSPPVKRPDVIAPHLAVDVVCGRGEDLVSIRMDLTHAANYNDPAPWRTPTYAEMRASSCAYCGDAPALDGRT